MTKAVKYTLLIVCILLIGQSLKAQENIASKASKVATSYVSSWEKLSAINDGYEPGNSGDKGPGAYGNWNSSANFNKWNWVEYDFSQNYEIVQSDVYWWTDGGGIQIPYSTYLDYWNIVSGKWEKIATTSGNGTQADKYNITTFDKLLTNKIRLYCISTAAQGILEWKVWGKPGEQIPSLSTYSIEPALEKGKTSKITLKAMSSGEIPVSAYVFKLDATITNLLSTVNELYTIEGKPVSNNTTGYDLPATDAMGNSSFEVTIPENIDPNDGLKVSVFFNNGFTPLTSYSIYAEGKSSPELVANTLMNSVDAPIVISFTDDTSWRSAVTSVKIDGISLDVPDFEISSGKLTLKPAAGNVAITKAGTKIVSVEATGYKPTQVSQIIVHGQISATKSMVDSSVKLYRPSVNSIKISAFDQFSNPIPGYIFKYDATLTNSTSTNAETYKINGEAIESSVSNQTLAATDANGLSKIILSIPAVVDKLDGIEVAIKLADGSASLSPSIDYFHGENEKEIYLTTDLKSHKDWSLDKTAQSENFVLFWGNKTGIDPSKPSNGGESFNPQLILDELEGFLSFYVDTMNFITNPETGNMSKYKFIIILMNTWDSGFTGNTPTGGSWDNKIGAMWVPPSNASGFVMAHEFGHMCQAMIPIQYPGKGFKNKDDNQQVGMFWEACANLMAYKVTGQLGNILTNHFLNTASMQFLSTVNYRQYEASFFPMYIIEKFGYNAFSKMWRMADVGDHPVDALMKALSITRDSVNKVVAQYAMHDVTWDYSCGNTMRNYLNGLTTSGTFREYTYPDLIPGLENTYIVPREMAPGDYGYNIIPLFPDTKSGTIQVKLSGYNNPAAPGGWNYGLVSVDAKGRPRYSKVFSENDGEVNFTIDPNDQKFYLLVSATPKSSHTYTWSPSWPQIYRYPFQFILKGALPAGHKAGYNSLKSNLPGAAHFNGGGWVASTAVVDPSVYVGSNAQVVGNAKVTGNVRVEDFAIIRDNAIVSGEAIIRGNAIVGLKSIVSDQSIVEKSARVYGGKVYGKAVITGSAGAFNCTVGDSAVVKDLAWLTGTKLAGSQIVGGDIEGAPSCMEGIYLQTTRTTCDGKNWITANEDINSEVPDYLYPQGDIPTAPFSLVADSISSGFVSLSWSKSNDDDHVNYLVFSNGNVVTRSSEPKAMVSGLNTRSSYTFTVRGIDVAGNISGESNALKLTTLPTSSKKIVSKKKYNIYPNPASDRFSVFLTNQSGQVSVYNNRGQMVYSKPITDKIEIQTAELGKAGVYLVKLVSPEFTINEKVVVK